MSEKYLKIYKPGKVGRSVGDRVSMALTDLVQSTFLVKSLFMRDLKAKYRQTMLGFLGALWPALVSTLVFAFLNSTQVLQVETGAVPYVLFAFTGSVFWTFFIEAISVPSNEFIANTSMLTRLDFPREAIVVKGMMNALMNLFIKMVFWILLLLFFKISFSVTIFGVFLTILNLLLIATGVGLILMPLMVIYRDINQIFTSLMSFLMYLTPVMYPITQLKYFGQYASYNPLTKIFDFMRACVFEGEWSHLGYNLGFLAVSFGLVCFGWVIYRVSIPFLIERMQA